MAYILGILGEAEIILRIWGAMEKYFHGAEDFFSGIWGEQCIFFSGIKGAQTPLGPPGKAICNVC